MEQFNLIKHKISKISSEELHNSDWIEERFPVNTLINGAIVGKPDEGQLHYYWI